MLNNEKSSFLILLQHKMTFYIHICDHLDELHQQFTPAVILTIGKTIRYIICNAIYGKHRHVSDHFMTVLSFKEVRLQDLFSLHVS